MPQKASAAAEIDLNEIKLGNLRSKSELPNRAEEMPAPAAVRTVHHRPQPSLTPECTICYAQKSNAIILECGHGGLCYDCGVRLLKLNHVCPFCRQPAVAVYKVQKTDHASLLQASDAAVYIAPGRDKEKICREILSRGGDVS